MSTIPTLYLTSLEWDGDHVTASCEVAGHRFRAKYFAEPFAPTYGAPNPLLRTREELAVMAIVRRVRAGERVEFPTPLVPPSELEGRDRRRWSFFETPYGESLLAKPGATPPRA